MKQISSGLIYCLLSKILHLITPAFAHFLESQVVFTFIALINIATTNSIKPENSPCLIAFCQEAVVQVCRLLQIFPE